MKKIENIISLVKRSMNRTFTYEDIMSEIYTFLLKTFDTPNCTFSIQTSYNDDVIAIFGCDGDTALLYFNRFDDPKILRRRYATFVFEVNYLVNLKKNYD